MKLLKFYFVLLALTSFSSLSAKPLNLLSLVDYGLNHSSSVHNTATTYKSKEIEKNSAKATFYPSLDFVSKHGYADTDPLEKPKRELSEVGLLLKQSIFNNFKDEYALDIADLEKQYAYEAHQEAVSRLIADVHTSLFKYCAKMEAYVNAKEKHSLISEQFAALEKSYKAGFKPQTDYLRFKAQFQRSSISLENLKTETESLKDKIAVIIGYEDSAPLDIETIKPNYEKLPAYEPAQTAMESHFTIQKLSLKEKISEFYSKISDKNSGFDIQLNLEGSYSASDYLGYEDRTFTDVDSKKWSAYLSINYPLFDAGKSSNDFKVAVNEKVIAAENKEHAKRELQRELKDLYRSLKLNKETAKLNLELLKLERDNFNLLKTKYQQGQVNILELTTALENLESSKNSYSYSYFQILSDQSSLMFHNKTFGPNQKTLTL